MTNEALSTSFSFPKSQRLKSRKSIEELFKSGSSFYLPPITLKYYHSGITSQHQVLFAVPKKYHKKAVNRNLIKRRLREAYRHHKHILSELNQGYLLGFLYLSSEIPSYASVELKLIQLLQRLADKSKRTEAHQNKEPQ